MASILDLKSKREIAYQLHNSIVNIIKRANKTIASTNKANLVNLYYAAKRFEDNLAALLAAGYSLDAIGVVMGQEFEFDWNSVKAELNAFKNTKLPDFTAIIKSNETVVLATTLSATQEEDIPLTAGALNIVRPLVQAIADTGFTAT